jgi:uncharacterized protein YrrD
MARLREIEGAELYGDGGAQLGTIERVLFHPSEPRAVALMVRPNPMLTVVPMPVAYVAWSAIRVAKGVVRFAAKKLTSRRVTETAVGHDMDLTVIWRGMPVAASDRAELGSVSDVMLADDGSVEGLEVSGGAVGDVATGRMEAPSEMVVGFEDGAVRLNVSESALVTSGGLARKAAEVSEAAKTAASTMAGATGDAVVDASYITGRAIRSAVRSKPVKRTKVALKGIADAFRDGYKDTPPK